VTTLDNRPVAVGIASRQPAILEYAVREAERAGCSIRIIHAYSVPPSAMGSLYGLDVDEAYRAGGQDVLDEAVGHLSQRRTAAPVEIVLTHGFAPSVLEAESAGARVMVIGPDDAKPWYIRLFEGRSARHLAAHSECPVVVVPNGWDASDDGTSIVVMVDGERQAHGPLKFAFDTASARGAELTVLHVASPEEGAYEPQWDAIRRVVDSFFDRHPEVRGVSQAVKGDVRETALPAAEGAALLIIGRPHERRIRSFLMDLLTQEILAEAGCPVAIVPGAYGD